MRGSLKLFQDVVTPQPQPQAVMTVTKQGRSADLHAQRNECLLARYFYYINFTEKRYEAVLNDLSKEFFIAAYTIQGRIDENYEKLLALKQQNPTKAYFIKKWPHLVW
jgi:hypothetical protein